MRVGAACAPLMQQGVVNKLLQGQKKISAIEHLGEIAVVNNIT